MNREPQHKKAEFGDSQKGRRRVTGAGSCKLRWWIGTAAVLAAVVVAGCVLCPMIGRFGVKAGALETAQYPELKTKPNPADYYNQNTGEYDFEAYSQAQKLYVENQGTLEQKEGYAEGLEGFFEKTIPQFLSGEDGENAVYSPLNVYMALAMLAEITDGSSRQQILDLLGSQSMESLREQAQAVWKGTYQNDGANTVILASSLWLRDDFSYNRDTLKTLVDTYYASSFQGKMGSQEYNLDLRDWLNEQTGGLLEEQIQGIQLSSADVLALAATLYYKVGWYEEFQEEDTWAQPFYGPSGEKEVEFLHRQEKGTYYRGENFGAVRKNMGDGGNMWMVLPDEGVTPQQLLDQGEAGKFFMSVRDWDNLEAKIINLALPKFDVSSQTSLLEGLKTLGVTDVMDSGSADFSPLSDNAAGLFLSQAEHSVRVAVDEVGITAAAFTYEVVTPVSAGMDPEEIDFVLDRPFLFCITSQDGLPLFVGVVNQP